MTAMAVSIGELRDALIAEADAEVRFRTQIDQSDIEASPLHLAQVLHAALPSDGLVGVSTERSAVGQPANANADEPRTATRFTAARAAAAKDGPRAPNGVSARRCCCARSKSSILAV